MMDCNNARPLLNVLSDGMLNPRDSAMVLDHLNDCNACKHEWEELEALRNRFKVARRTPEAPANLLLRVEQTLATEDQRQSAGTFLKRYASIAVAIAATLLIAGAGVSILMQVNRTQHVAQGTPASQVGQQTTVSGDQLIAQVADQSGGLVVPKAELDNKVGYPLVYVRLPEWQMKRSAVYRPVVAAAPVVRFDFIKQGGPMKDKLTCYQAPQGTIKLAQQAATKLGDKQVVIGSRGELQYAFWSQNGRDYLFVTPMDRAALENIVTGA